MKTNEFTSIVAKIGGEIVSCLNCQPYEDGEPVWMAEPTRLDDLFDRANVPDTRRRRLTARLRCRNCHARVGQYDIVGTEFTHSLVLAVRPGETLCAA